MSTEANTPDLPSKPKTAATADEGGSGKKKRAARRFPSATFEEALPLGFAIQKHGSGKKVRRLTLFGLLDKSPDSGPTRHLITNSAKYGLTLGSYAAEYLELTPLGYEITDPETPPRKRLQREFELAIEGVEPFKLLYDTYKENRLPTLSVLQDRLREAGYKEEVEECVETFVSNLSYLKLLRTIAGAERIITIEMALEGLPATALPDGQSTSLPPSSQPATITITTTAAPQLQDSNSICFYITPIGDENSAERKHSDLFLGALVEPAIEKLGMKVVRADQISKSGMITSQIIQHILRAKLVVADLSFHNPNVFYELSLRHACRLPTVQVIRSRDKIPFDLSQFRTIRIDDSDVYSLVPKLEIYRAEISQQARQSLEDPEAVDNPITTFFPSLKVTF